ncbi:MAG: V-type ATP synthase subunit E [Lachnospiraceae bacterium]
MTIEDKLTHFQKTAITAAREQSNKIIDEYTDALETIAREFRQEKDQQADIQIKSETDRLTLEHNKDLYEAQLKIRRELSRHQNDLKQKLFVEVRRALEEYMNTPAYKNWLVKHIRAAKEFAGDEDVTIYIDPADQRLLHSLEGETQTALTISKYSFFGGIRAVLPGRNILIDESFETKLKEEQETFSFGGDSHE